MLSLSPQTFSRHRQALLLGRAKIHYRKPKAMFGAVVDKMIIATIPISAAKGYIDFVF